LFVRVRGRSMTPTLQPGDVLWAEKPQDLKRGDMIVFRKSTLLLKRVIGLPGETVAIQSSRISINQSPLEEPYVPPAAYLQPLPDQTFQIPSASYVVLGDARDDSLDSRRLGPVKIQEIEGVARRRVWPPARWSRLAIALVAVAFSVSPAARAASPPPLLLAFASEIRLAMMIGKYDPSHGWVASTNFYTPPVPGDVFTLYGPPGEVGEVMITNRHEAYRDGVFATWSAKTSRWDNHSVPYALAVSGHAPVAGTVLEPIPLENSEYQSIVARYLKSRGLHVEDPFLTQAFHVPIEGHGRDEVLLVAHSDASAMSDDKAADVYAVALLWWNDHGQEKIWPLASQTSHKPAGRTLEEHERYHGKRNFLRILCVLDIDGDGWKEIVLYRAKDAATQVDIFHFDGRRLRKVLSAEKAGYN
jgi:signal peptidase I